MTFTSLLFAPFIALVALIYWKLCSKSARAQNTLLLLASLGFILYNDVTSAIVITLSGWINFMLVPRMAAMEEGASKKYFFYAGCLFNIGILAYYKYLGDLLEGWKGWSLFPDAKDSIYLPLGLSFFTFQLISYWIDVYNEETDPEDQLFDFAIYLFYFPKLVSGPIERTTAFLPQLKKLRTFSVDLMTDGMRQFLWGFFKKMVVSVHCFAFYQEFIKAGNQSTGANILLASIMHMLYIYADFSGYSDMACGISKGFGIRITNNFAFPFFATNISDFWKRWHISLTSWIMKYVYTPITFLLRKYGRVSVGVAVLLAFVTVGVWHGLKSGYVVFGTLHALFFLPLILRGGNLNQRGDTQRGGLQFAKMAALFVLLCVTGLFFRSETAMETWSQIRCMISTSMLRPNLEGVLGLTNLLFWSMIAVMLMVEWINQKQEHGLDVKRFSTGIRWTAYFAVMLFIFFFSEFTGSGFIYAHF